MKTSILELFGVPTELEGANWPEIERTKYCPFLERTCVKTRKSDPSIIIGTCAVYHGAKDSKGVIICPHRFLERKQIFMDCIHLLTLHEPGNELHRVAELAVPGGSVDYVLVSTKGGKVVDFVGIEVQAVDTTGSLWGPRQRFLKSVGVEVDDDESKGTYGMNWKMTAKTTLFQLHHKVETFEHLSKHLVLVFQEPLLAYMRKAFNFGHIQDAKLGDAMHFHAYELQESPNKQLHLSLKTRISTDANGVARCLGMQVNPNIEFEVIVARLQAKISERTVLTL